MDTFIYIMIFIIGTVFGSFFTLAVYRIPLKKNITHERSFCPTCNHRLEFLDLIPVLSYLFLKGKCRYCGEKIRIRYFLLEILSGIVFVIAYRSFNIHFPYFDIAKLLGFASFVFMYITLAITAGIDKEYKRIHKGVIAFGVIMQIAYILYLYIFENINIYRYSIYIAIIIMIYILNIIVSKRKKDTTNNKENCKNTYLLEVLLLSFYIVFCIEEIAFFIVAILTISVIFLYQSVQCMIFIYKNKSEDKKDNMCTCKKVQIPIGFFMNITTIIVVIIKNFLIYVM